MQLTLSLFIALALCGFAACARSGLPWLSGEATPANGKSSGNDNSDADLVVDQLNQFARYRGRKVDIYNSKSDSSDFGSLRSSIFDKQYLYKVLYDNQTAIEQVIDYIPDNSGASGNDFVACKNGEFDAQHRQIAARIQSYPRRAPYIIRLGHELNDPNVPYNPLNDPNAPTNYDIYKKCFCRIAGIYHDEISNPPALIDWNWLRNTGETGIDPSAAYPESNGRACMDIIGVDSYNNNVAIGDATAFNKYANKVTSQGWPSGPRSWMNFAKSKGRGFGIAEWGVTNFPGTDDDAVADSGAYIAGMYGLFQEAAGQGFSVFYENYFNILADGRDHRINDAAGDNHNPQASGAYKRAWQP